MSRIFVPFLLLLLLPYNSLAQSPYDLIEKGEKQVQRGKLQAAYKTFQKALKLDPRNSMAINALAQVASFLELHAESVAYYVSYLYLEGTYLTSVEEIHKAMKKQEASIKNAAYIKLKVEPQDAEIVVNSLPMAKGSLSLPVAAGKSYDISISATDYHPYHTSLVLGPGEEKNLNIRLKKIIFKGKVELKILPDHDVTVYVDTRPVGSGLSEVETQEGKRLFCFKKPGFDRWWRYVDVPRNGTVVLEVTLYEQSGPDESCEVWPEEE